MGRILDEPISPIGGIRGEAPLAIKHLSKRMILPSDAVTVLSAADSLVAGERWCNLTPYLLKISLEFPYGNIAG
jgi:hypothetical protein